VEKKLRRRRLRGREGYEEDIRWRRRTRTNKWRSRKEEEEEEDMWRRIKRRG
jgi:hypothetical protein